MNSYDALDARLLAIGGTRCVRPPGADPYLVKLAEAGRTFDPADRKRVRGQRNGCHQNAALAYLRHHHGLRGDLDIATGYALHDDGLWRQHTWLWDGRRILETTVEFDKYFGVPLAPEDAVEFIMHVLVLPLPGCDKAFRRSSSLENCQAPANIG